MKHHHAFGPDLDDLHAIGHGLSALFTGAIGVAIVAVILSANSASPNIISTFFGFVTWLVGQVIQPVSAGVNVVLNGRPGPAGSLPTTGDTAGNPTSSILPAQSPQSFLSGNPDPFADSSIPTMRITP